MSQFWSPIVHKLTPYVPGEQPKVDNLIKLNTNENPYGPSPQVHEALALANDDALKRYPDPNCSELKQAIADYHSINVDQVFVGNGSDEVLAHTFLGLLKKDGPLLYPDISYSFYPVYCGLYEIEQQPVALGDEFVINVDDYNQPNGGIIIPNPNAPTGRLLSLDDIKTLLENNPENVVVMDEAYIDFGGESAVALINDYKNLLVIQTLSKSRSLAGLRVGFAMGDANLIEGLERVKNSFNSYPLDRFAIKGATASFADEDYFQACCQKVINSRQWLTDELEALDWHVIPSHTNFIFAKPTGDTQAMFEQLREKKILVRYFNKPRINEYLRISIGTQQECEALLTAINEITAS